jgi:drug/metabolite transporter (DMT)-like permease
LLANVATYSLLFWGMTRVDSGIAAVVNLSMVQVSLLAISVLCGAERLTGSKVAASLLGVLGLLVLYAGELHGTVDAGWMVGVAAVALSAIAYGLGSVLSRDLLRRYPPIIVAGWIQLLGGIVLLALATTEKPDLRGTAKAFAEPQVLVSWLYLVVFGSVIAFSLYLRLILDWSPSRAGLHAFISPALAVLAGVVLVGERLDTPELIGIVLMMTATGVALRRRSESRTA